MTTRTDPKKFSWDSHGGYCAPGGTPSFTNTSSVLSWTDSRTGVSCPGYRRKIALCQDATTVFSGTRVRVTNKAPSSNVCGYWAQGNQRYPFWERFSDASGLYTLANLAYTPPSASTTSRAISFAKMSFVSKANSAMIRFKGMEFLGELKEAIEMIRHPASSLRNGLRDYVNSARSLSGRGLSRRSMSQILADTWLEYSFGWTPLLSDIKSGVDAYNTLRKKGFSGKYIMGYGAEHDPPGVSFAYQSQAYTVWNMTTVTSPRTEVIIRGFVKPTVYGWATPDMRLFGFSLDRFIPTLWELMPYSWLIDYFSNIGKIIEATMFCRSAVAWSCMTKRQESTVRRFLQINDKLTRSGHPTYTFTSVLGSAGVTSRTWTQVDRGPVDSLVPDLVFYMPRFVSQGINIAAVLAQGHLVEKMLNRK